MIVNEDDVVTVYIESPYAIYTDRFVLTDKQCNIKTISPNSETGRFILGKEIGSINEFILAKTPYLITIVDSYKFVEEKNQLIKKR